MKPILKAAAVATVAVGLVTVSMSANAWGRFHGPGPLAVGAAVGAMVGLAVGAAVTAPVYAASAPVYYAPPPPPPVVYAQPTYVAPGYYYPAPVVVRPRVVYAPY